MEQWQPIETAPKDGTRILAAGMAYPELVKNEGWWITAETSQPRVPFTMIVHWHESWYDAEIDLGNGTFRKEPKLSFAMWWPEPHAFQPMHWMPLPDPPIVSGLPPAPRDR